VNHSPFTVDAFMVNQDKSFTGMLDMYGNPLHVTPKSFIYIPVNSNQIELFSGDVATSNWNSIHGTVISNINNKVHISYWGAGCKDDWLCTVVANTIPLTYSRVIYNANQVQYCDQQLDIQKTIVQHQSLFPTKLYIVNYNKFAVHFYIYSSVSSFKITYNNTQPNSFITILIPSSFSHLDDISIIAASTNGGIQGTVLVNDRGNVHYLYLFGQEPLPIRQSIGIFT
jgi:hypothetical protein